MPRPKPKQQKAPTCLWAGPYSGEPQGGLTFSLLCKFLVCRHRFWLKVVQGWKEVRGWDHFTKSMEYGSIFHVMEEEYLKDRSLKYAQIHARAYLESLIEKYPGQEKELGKIYQMALTQFPIYIKFWLKNDPDARKRKQLYQEESFRIFYELPSGRKICLRGKIDSIHALKDAIYVQENKTKGDIDVEGLQATVSENLQTMFYQIVTRQLWEKGLYARTEKDKVTGVIYNVVRRPLADRYAIKQKKGETDKEFYRRLGEVIEANPKHYFHRWKVGITDQDIQKFKVEVFNPILEQLCDWWESIREDPSDPWHTWEFGRYAVGSPNMLHYRTPFGVYNSLFNGYRGDFWSYLTYGRTTDMEKCRNLFPELEE